MQTPSTLPSLVDRVLEKFDRVAPPSDVYAHCDIPCGIYDPHMAQIAALTVIRMVQLIEGLQQPGADASKTDWDTYGMQISRYSATKEEHARLCEHELIILWTDYFRPEHVEKNPNLQADLDRQAVDQHGSRAAVAGRLPADRRDLLGHQGRQDEAPGVQPGSGRRRAGLPDYVTQHRTGCGVRGRNSRV